MATASYLMVTSPPGADGMRMQARALVRQVDDYLVPRLSQLDAPMVVVVGGPTGAGKSTLVNSIVRRPVSPAGVLRPTTRAPVLVCHPDEIGWYDGSALLPTLPRADTGGGPSQTGGPAVVAGALRVVTHWRLPRGLALLDAPDLDSVVAANRDLATQLLAAADLWLFVTSAARYADAVPWAALAEARARSTTVAVVLDRVPPGAEEVLHDELTGMLTERGLDEAAVFTVAEAPVDSEGLLPDEVVAGVRGWLLGFAADQQARNQVIRASLTGALGTLRPRVAYLVDGLVDQERAAADLTAAVRRAYDEGLAAVASGIDDGSVLRGEVLARWHELVGTGRLMEGLQSRVGRWRARARRVRLRPPAADLEVAVEDGVAALLAAAAQAADERARAAWAGTPAGQALLAGAPRRRAPEELAAQARTLVRMWQAGVLELVRDEDADRRSGTPLASYGVNGLGLLVMVAVFAEAGAPAGVEAGVEAGTSIAGGRLLEAILGDAAVRRLASAARADLLGRVDAVLRTEADRMLRLVPALPVASADLRGLADRLDDVVGHALASSDQWGAR